MNDKVIAIRYLSIELGKSDKEIGDFLGVHRSNITHYRKKQQYTKTYHCWKTRRVSDDFKIKKIRF